DDCFLNLSIDKLRWLWTTYGRSLRAIRIIFRTYVGQKDSAMARSSDEYLAPIAPSLFPAPKRLNRTQIIADNL
ncbi:MAG: hypothetical protein ACRC11_17960, partial [Xenococcaceae cyanobacterium]